MIPVFAVGAHVANGWEKGYPTEDGPGDSDGGKGEESNKSGGKYLENRKHIYVKWLGADLGSSQ